MQEKMKVAVIAHDGKKAEMVAVGRKFSVIIMILRN